MALLLFVLRKMISHRWLVLSLLIGLMIAVALVSVIPIYTSASLQKNLTGTLENMQRERNIFPGGMRATFTMSHLVRKYPSHTMEAFRKLEAEFKRASLAPSLPPLAEVTVLSSEAMEIKNQAESGSGARYVRLHAFSGMEDHVQLVDGAMPSTKLVQGVYEAAVTESAAQFFNMVIGTTYELTFSGSSAPLRVKPVGIIEPSQPRDPYWFEPIDTLKDGFILPDELFRKEFAAQHPRMLGTVKLFTALKYQELKIDRVPAFMNMGQEVYRSFAKDVAFPILKVEVHAKSVIKEYMEQKEQLIRMLWSVNTPILIMLSIYVFMISRLIIERQRTLISVLRSRGAGPIQIVVIYFIESIILGIIAILAGPQLGLVLSEVLGASNGFMQFVQRSSLPVYLSSEVYWYSFWTVLCGIVMMMIPVISSAYIDIVDRKRLEARGGTPIWKRFFLDLLLLGGGIYGWYSLDERVEAMPLVVNTKETLTEVFEPLTFVYPALFIIGAALLFIRIYPWLVQLATWLGRKRWGPEMYYALTQIGRSFTQYQMLMIFIIMTVAVSIFSSSTARTMNSNMEERIRYHNGADITLKTEWESKLNTQKLKEKEGEDGKVAIDLNAAVKKLKNEGVERRQYIEPPYTDITSIDGIEQATKVFRRADVTLRAHKKVTLQKVNIMGIEPKKFGETAWFRDDLLAAHWYHYLNLLAKEPSAVLISQSIANRLTLKPGDKIVMQWENYVQAEFVVYAVISHWPSWTPTEGEGKELPSALVVANLDYLHNMVGMEPYEVWIKMKNEAESKKLYESIKSRQLNITSLVDANQLWIKEKNSVSLLGLNGALTSGFLISLAITLGGFLIFWVLTFQARTVQYGVMRAMGVSKLRVISGIIGEQLLTAGAGVFAGLTIGAITSSLFVPFMQLFVAKDAPPFQVRFEASDEHKIYLFLGVILLMGVGVLSVLVSRTRVHQAVKLGEDA